MKDRRRKRKQQSILTENEIRIVAQRRVFYVFLVKKIYIEEKKKEKVETCFSLSISDGFIYI